MDYYQGSNTSSFRGRTSYRGSSFRGSGRGDSYRGSRGSSRGSYVSYPPRGRGGSSSYPSKYETTPKYAVSTEGGKYGTSSASYGRYDDSYRRSESSFGGEHRSENVDFSRKRDRSESYSTPQGPVSRRPHEDYHYRGNRSPSPRPYDDSRSFKKPRTAEYRSSGDYRSKAPERVRSLRGRSSYRGSFPRRGRGDPFGRSRRGTSSRQSSTTASTSEILAIRRAKILQNRIKEQEASASSDNAEKAEKKEEVEDKPTTDENNGTETPAEGGDKEAAPKEETRERALYARDGRPFIKLECPCCKATCVTFKEYAAHLNQSTHIRSMREKSESLKQQLAAMRIEQRDKQKEADENDLTSMTTRSYFCAVCKLNYSQERATHQSSELHEKLREFLMPYCKTCYYKASTPLMYENHLCSLEHLRRKHIVEEREKKRSSSGLLDKFMVLDSVGSGDEAEEKESEEKKEKEEDLLLGLEFIREVKAKFCEVCRTYLPRTSSQSSYERALKRHCQTKEHLRCYLHFGNEALLEKIHADDENAENKTNEKKDGETKEGEAEEPLDGDKLWDGLSELLDETQPRGKSDDEDEEEGGRFDRFKSKEKENGAVDEEAAVADEAPPSQEPAEEPAITA